MTLPKVSIAAVLSLIVVWATIAYWMPSANAADQTTTLLVNIQSSLASISSKVVGLDAAVSEIATQERNDRAALLRRITDDEQKLADLTNGMADLDASRQNQNYVSLASRTSAIETKLDDAKRDRDKAVEAAKADHDALMAWVRPSALSLFGSLGGIIATLILTHLRGKIAKDDSDRMEKKVDGRRERIVEAVQVKIDEQRGGPKV